MHNERSGAPAHHEEAPEGELLSPVEAADLYRGQLLKRSVRSAAALRDIYTDAALAKAVRVSRGALRDWWEGARPEVPTILRLAKVTGLSPDELTAFLYAEGPVPKLPMPQAVVEGVLEGLARDQRSQPPEAPDTPPASPGRRPRGSGAGRE
jgi:transcriptional regulator with XRE-family HTH domain